MSKITELGNITGSNTTSRDLFVTVSLDLGENGTKNITRSELINALQEEDFDNISITGGNLSNVSLTNTPIVNPNIDLSDAYTPFLESESYFVVKDVSRNITVQLSFADLQTELSEVFKKSTKRYISQDGDDSNDGSLLRPYRTFEKGVDFMQTAGAPVSLGVYPGVYNSNGNLSIPDNCTIVSTNGIYATTVVMNEGYEETNLFLVGSGCYIQGIAAQNLRVDDFDNPTTGFMVAFRPGANILRSPYIRDISQISNYFRESIAAPLDPVNANPMVGRGGGVVLADRAVLNNNSIFPYMLCFGATPRSPNGMGYVAKNGAGINGISSLSIFSRCAFYALNGGQITLNNSGTQFGDISMRARGSTPIVIPNETSASLIVSEQLADDIDNNSETIIDFMWNDLIDEGYTVSETFTKRDGRNLLKSLSNDFRSGQQAGSRIFVAGLFDYRGDYVFDETNIPLFDAFIHSYEQMRDFIKTNYTTTVQQDNMIDGLFNDIIIGTLQTPTRQNFGSLIESLAHQFNLAGAGVNQNALPLNFRRVGKPISAASSVLAETGGRVRWSGSDELNNQFFSRGLKINGRTGRIEGRPFTSSVRRLARRAANSRI